jgi:hypothetical protein
MTPKPKDVLADLIERLKQATGPDRELDRMIAVHPKTPSCGVAKGTELHRVAEAEGCGSLDDNGVFHPIFVIPRYTESLDAAMTLVPEGWSWHLSGGDLSVGGKPYACIASNELSGGPEPWLEEREVEEATAATPAIALCIAALTAISKGAEHG